MSESLETLQRQIGSVSELHSIVRTMKTLSAVAIRQYEKAAESLEAYQRTVEYGLAVVLRDRRTETPEKKSVAQEGVGLVVFGSDTGLCGRFNEDAAGLALGIIAESAGTVRLVAVGGRICPLLEERGHTPECCVAAPGTVAAVTPTVQEVLVHLEAWHAEGIGRIELVYNQQARVEVYRPFAQRILPVELAGLPRYRRQVWPSRTLPTYTLEGGRLFAALLRQFLFAELFRACTQSHTSENASRLRAMQAAERNIEERLEALTADFRQSRQTAITEELLDVVAGFEVLRDKS